MGAREMDRFLEQWQIGIRDLHRRTILALTPGSESTGRPPTCWPRRGTTPPAAAANHAWWSARFGARRSPSFCRGTLHLQARRAFVTSTWAGHLRLSAILESAPGKFHPNQLCAAPGQRGLYLGHAAFQNVIIWR